MTDDADDQGDRLQVRLHSVLILPGAVSIGKTLQTLNLAQFGVEVTAIRRRNIRSQFPDAETSLNDGDVIVLRGLQESLAQAEIFLLKGL